MNDVVSEINDIIIDRQFQKATPAKGDNAADPIPMYCFTLEELELLLFRMGARIKIAVLALMRSHRITIVGKHNGNDKLFKITSP